MWLQKYGHALVDRGYEIVPIKHGKKAPMLPGWQDIRAGHEDVDRWASNGHRDGGIGILCRNVVAIDIDCHDKSLNHMLLDWLKDNVGAGPVRVGQKPKCIMAFRVDEPMTKIRSAEFASPDCTRNAVEVLATGQQFVAYGIHPGTQQPYSWPVTHLADTPREKLPVITREQAQSFVAQFEKLAAQRGWELVRSGATSQPVDINDISTLRPKLGVTLEQLEQMLEGLDPDSTHDDWVRVGMALHHETEGSPEGLALWDSWSARGAKYEDGVCERRWKSFGRAGKTPVTAAYLKRQVAVTEGEQVTEDKLPKMLTHWAFVQVEGAARVIREDLPIARPTLYRLEDLKKEFQNSLVLDTSGEKPKRVNLVDKWLEHPDRRTYSAGLTFAPDSDVAGRYNLWRGWSYDAEPGDVAPWIEFVTEVIASGDAGHANYIIAWAAQMVQEPLNKIGVGLVLRGRKGTGKTKFGELLGGLVHQHHRIVSRAEHVTGHFNRHLEDTLLLQADEAFWAGAKSSEGALKDLLTNPSITIERKGVDAYTAPNYTRVLFTSNEEWVVPATLDERRFAVFDVSDCRQQDTKYFAALDRWYRQGGASALLHYLRTFDLSKINVRSVPATGALSDQKIKSFGTIDAWLLACLTEGELREHRVAGERAQWGDEIPKSLLYDIYASSVRGRYESPVNTVWFWRHLRDLEGVLEGELNKRIGGNQVKVVKLGELSEARRIFAERNRISVEWPDVGKADPLDPSRWDEGGEGDVPF